MDGKIITLVDSESKSATFTVTSQDLLNYDRFALHCVISSASSLAADVTLETSLDQTNWIEDPDFLWDLTGNTSHIFYDPEITYRYFRLTVTFTAGSATFDMKMLLKG